MFSRPLIATACVAFSQVRCAATCDVSHGNTAALQAMTLDNALKVLVKKGNRSPAVVSPLWYCSNAKIAENPAIIGLSDCHSIISINACQRWRQ